MRRAVILTGSPRRQGNCFQLADGLCGRLTAAGCAVSRFDAAFLHVEGCRACGGCYAHGRPCAFGGDDFNAVAAEIERADVLVLISPVYWYTFPSALKAVIDRFYAFWMGKRLFTGKRCALIAVCADEPRSTFDGLLISYRETVALLRGENAGELLFPGVRGTTLAGESAVQTQLDALTARLLHAEET